MQNHLEIERQVLQTELHEADKDVRKQTLCFGIAAAVVVLSVLNAIDEIIPKDITVVTGTAGYVGTVIQRQRALRSRQNAETIVSQAENNGFVVSNKGSFLIHERTIFDPSIES